MDSISLKTDAYDYTLIRHKCCQHTKLLINSGTRSTNVQYKAVLRVNAYDVAKDVYSLQVVFVYSGATTEYKFCEKLTYEDMRKLREFLLT